MDGDGDDKDDGAYMTPGLTDADADVGGPQTRQAQSRGRSERLRITVQIPVRDGGPVWVHEAVSVRPADQAHAPEVRDGASQARGAERERQMWRVGMHEGGGRSRGSSSSSSTVRRRRSRTRRAPGGRGVDRGGRACTTQQERQPDPLCDPLCDQRGPP
ncbi:hypothetical protein EIP86_007341 [Pleurotus ostreatoroseus]|nr:hypothetical protein EIP86_007341 [Pleurotus ostreatoroseus]